MADSCLFYCVFLPTKVFISSIFNTLENKLNIFGSRYIFSRGLYIFSSLYCLYIRLYQICCSFNNYFKKMYLRVFWFRQTVKFLKYVRSSASKRCYVWLAFNFCNCNTFIKYSGNLLFICLKLNGCSGSWPMFGIKSWIVSCSSFSCK